MEQGLVIKVKGKLHPRVRRALAQIGVPETRPFVPDAFQLEAVSKLEYGDVLVSAPTGSGKTWIAVTAMDKLLGQAKRVWYATPLKALSNSMYFEFGQRYGQEKVGILTGDRRENPGAPLIVGTTEILRNHLYDSMSQGESLNVDLVVLDEAHYLGDHDRGMVWEEVMIYLPSRIRLLLLSATIPNAREIADWLLQIRGERCSVVFSEDRPVPLYPLFLFPNEDIAPLKHKRGLLPSIQRFQEQNKRLRRRFSDRNANYGRILALLRELDLLPAIFFLKSRAECNQALLTCHAFRPSGLIHRNGFDKALQGLLRSLPFLGNHRQLPILRAERVAAHHAGQLPYWKLLVERLMKEGWLDAIFSTSTVAAGVNFPARTVVVMQSDRFNGREFVDLTATELHQMTGRAGRRGMDNIGFVMVIPGPFQNAEVISALLDSPPEPIISQMRVNFSMTLNLLLSHTPQGVKGLFEHSFATHQGHPEVRELEKEYSEIKSRLEEKLDRTLCSGLDQLLDFYARTRELDQSIKNLEAEIKSERRRFHLVSYLKPGRFFLSPSGRLFCVLTTPDPETGFFRAVLVRHRVRIRKGHLRFRNFHLNRIQKILDQSASWPSEANDEERAVIIQDSAPHMIKVLSLDAPFDSLFEEKLRALESHRQQLVEERNVLSCQSCPQQEVCFGAKRPHVAKLIEKAVSISRAIKRHKEQLWNDFTRHFRFLREEGYVDEEGVLSFEGRWAARLRLDQPLMVAECIKRGVFTGHSPEILSGLMALFVADKPGEINPQHDTLKVPQLSAAYEKTMGALERLRLKQERQGFESPIMPYWSALTLYEWSRGQPWQRVVELSDLDEGDLAMLVYRTADHLRQLTSLEDTHPALSRTAEEAIALILRDPVIPL
jgi:ATP-dependent RNA helicase HelY